MPPDAGPAVRPGLLTDRLELLGRKVTRAAKMAVAMISFLGQVIAVIGGIVIHPRRLRLTSLVHHCQEVGVNAVCPSWR